MSAEVEGKVNDLCAVPFSSSSLSRDVMKITDVMIRVAVTTVKKSSRQKPHAKHS